MLGQIRAVSRNGIDRSSIATKPCLSGQSARLELEISTIFLYLFLLDPREPGIVTVTRTTDRFGESMRDPVSHSEAS